MGMFDSIKDELLNEQYESSPFELQEGYGSFDEDGSAYEIQDMADQLDPDNEFNDEDDYTDISALGEVTFEDLDDDDFDDEDIDDEMTDDEVIEDDDDDEV
jgi:hypothetical protein